jgi:hypothetical protein
VELILDDRRVPGARQAGAQHTPAGK